MNSTTYYNIYNNLQSILESNDSSFTIDEWIDTIIKPHLPIHEFEHSLSKKPNALKRVLECIVVESRKMASHSNSEYLFQPNIFDLVGVVRSNGEFHIVVTTSCYPNNISNNIDFVEIETLLAKQLEKAMYKGRFFFYSISDQEKNEIYRKYPNLQEMLELERKCVAKYKNGPTSDQATTHALDHAPDLAPDHTPDHATINAPDQAPDHATINAPDQAPDHATINAPDHATINAPDHIPDHATINAPDHATINAPDHIPDHVTINAPGI